MSSTNTVFLIEKKAIKMLEKKMFTEQEMLKKLSLLFPDNKTEINEVMANLKLINMINDEKFVNMYLNYEINNHSRGKQYYWSKLSIKGIEKDIFDNVWHILAPDELTMAKKNIEQNSFRFKNEADSFKKRKKIQNFLYNRGFDFNIIKQLF